MNLLREKWKEVNYWGNNGEGRVGGGGGNRKSANKESSFARFAFVS